MSAEFFDIPLKQGETWTYVFTLTAPRVPSTWAASHVYALGEVVKPTPDTLRLYRATTAGTSASTQPVWPTVNGDTVVDGGVTWICQPTADAPIDLTGATAAMQLREFAGGVDTPALALTNANGGLVMGGTAGTITASIYHWQTRALTKPSYAYDLFVVYLDGRRLKYLKGQVSVEIAVTR